jgi:DnaJ-domain-containing protein 1
VLLLCAAMSGQLDLAQDLHRRIERASKQWPLPQKLWLQVEAAVEKRALSLGADPYYGLVLHNGAVFADAHLFARVAIAYFSTSTFPRETVERALSFAAQQKARLVEVLVGLVSAERKPGFPARRAILRQIDDLQLPPALAEATTEFARKAFDKPVPFKRLTAGVRSVEMKRFIVEQTLLASLVDGRRSPREIEWTHSLGKQLGFSPEQLDAMELEMAEFYKSHRTVVDVFSLQGGAEVMGEEWVDEMSTTMKKNYRALLKEIRETGELSKLLARAARGQKLSSVEKAAMREQLINVAKAVPALAIFAAPGGLLLLLALAKVLPFDLLPSSFRDEVDERD